MKWKQFAIFLLVLLVLVQTCIAKKNKKSGKLKLKVGKPQKDPNLTEKEGKKQAKQDPVTDASTTDYKPDEVKGDPNKIQDVKDKYESGTPPKFPELPRTSDVTAHDSEITGCRDHPNAAKVCQRCDEPCFGEEHETYTYSYCRRSCGMCDKKTSTFHQYWRLRAASSFEPTWMLKEVEFYHLTTSNKSLIDDPKRGYAKNYYQGFMPSFAFDGDKETAWFPDNYGSNHSNNDDWIAFEFPVAVRIHGVRIVDDKDHPTAAPRKIYVEASDKKFEGFETKWTISNPTYNTDFTSTLNECPVLWKKYNDPDDSVWCFRLFAQRKTWDEAADICKEEGGSLASIISNDENEFLSQKINFCGYTWVGLSKQNGAYYWEDGSNSTFHDWKEDLKYSDDQTKNLVCVAMNPEGKWILFDCDAKHYFLCKKKIEIKEPPRPDLIPYPLPYQPEVPPVIFFYPNVTVPVINTKNLPAGSFPDANGEVVIPEEEGGGGSLESIFYSQTLKHLLEKGLKATPDMKPGENEDPGKYTKQLNKIALEVDDAGTRNESGVKPSVNLETSKLPQSMAKEIPVHSDTPGTPSTSVDPENQMGVSEPPANDKSSPSDQLSSPVNGPPLNAGPPSAAPSSSPTSPNNNDNGGTTPSNVPSKPSGSENKDENNNQPSGGYQSGNATSQPPDPKKPPKTDATTSQKPSGQKEQQSDSDAKVKPPKTQEGTESNPPSSVGEAGDEDDDSDDDSDEDTEDNDDSDDDDDDQNVPESPNQIKNKDTDADKGKDVTDKEVTVGGQSGKKQTKKQGGKKTGNTKSGKKKSLKSMLKKSQQSVVQYRSNVTADDSDATEESGDSSDTKELKDIIKSMNEEIV